MLEKAVAELKHDERTAIAKFLNPIGGFIDRDLHVFCYDTRDGRFTAWTTYRMLGVDIRTFREKDGTPIGQRIFDANKPDTIVTVDYSSPRPGENVPVPKQVFITIVGHQGCGVSYYK
jgi:cytochrome c